MNERNDIDTFLEDGYMVLDVFSEAQIDAMAKRIEDRINRVSAEVPGRPDCPGWTLASYHTSLGLDENVHRRVTHGDERYITLSDDMVQSCFHESVCRLLDHYWGHRETLITHRRGDLNAKLRDDSTSGFRLVRPGANDVAGVHADRYYGDVEGVADVSSSAPNVVTVWIPVVGFDERFSLRLAPGTHAIDHPREAFRQVSGYITHTCDAAYEAKFDYVRPKLRKGEAIVFHPNLLHGGSENLGDATRASLEPRLRDSRAFAPIQDRVSAS